MKNLMLSTAMVAALAGAAVAQTDTTTTGTTTTGTDAATGAGSAMTTQPGMAGSLFRTEARQGDILASDFIGMRLYAAAGQDATNVSGVQDNWDDIGEVNDVVLSQDGSVQAVLVDIGGFLGIGERKVAVDMSAIRFVADDATTDSPNDFFLVLNADRGALENAPAYGGEGMSAGSTAATGASGAMTNTDGTAGTALNTNTDGTATDGAATGTAMNGATVDTGTATGTGTAATGTDMATGTDANPDGTAKGGISDRQANATGDGTATTGTDTGLAQRSPITREGFAPVQREALTADRLEDAEAYDTQDERVGKIADLVLDADGQISQAVVDVGGFLGIGAKQVALPISDIDILQSADSNEIRVYVPHTKEQLQAMPEYQKS